LTFGERAPGARLTLPPEERGCRVLDSPSPLWGEGRVRGYRVRGYRVRGYRVRGYRVRGEALPR
ncbi:MAG: hypothetical protein ACREJE_13245, partial [Candidatus Rokuibacteriota bacterium]